MSTTANPPTGDTQASDIPAPLLRAHVPSGLLRSALKLADLALGDRVEHPWQRGVQLAADGGTLTVSAYRACQDSGTGTSVRVSMDAEPGSCGTAVLDHRELSRVLTAAAVGDRKPKADRTGITLTGAVVESPDIAVPVAEYPSAPVVTVPDVPLLATVDGARFFEHLNRALPVTAASDVLPLLTGVQLDYESGLLHIRAADLYRCVTGVMPADPWEGGSGHGHYRALIRRDVLLRILAVCGNYSGPIALGLPPVDSTESTRATLQVGAAAITPSLLSGQLADRWFAPADHEGTLTVPRQILIRAVRKAAALAHAKGAAKKRAYVRLTYSADEPGRMRVTPELQTPQEQDQARGLAVAARPSQEQPHPLGESPLTINGAFLLHALESFSSDGVLVHIPPMREGRHHDPVRVSSADADAHSHWHRIHVVRRP